MKKLVLLVSVFAMLLPTILLLGGCGIHTSPGSGEKVGQIVKLSKIGLVNKTWEGEIIRGGLNNGSGSMGGSFYFTVTSDAVAMTIQEYMKNQTEVLITYESPFIYSPFRTESDGHYLVSVQPVAKK